MSRRTAAGLAGTALVVALGACSEGVAHVEPSPSPAPAADAAPPAALDAEPELRAVAFDFGACTGSYASARSCGRAEIPVDYRRPDGRKLELFVARVGSTAADATQVYMLQGGPGSTGAGLLGAANNLLRANPRTEVIIVEHRGVARSTRLACDRAEARGGDVAAQAAACLDEVRAVWGDDLAQFNVSNAARDVAVAIASIRKSQRAFVYGVSYGTFVAHRFLQLAPWPIDGVVLDSAINPEEPWFHEDDKRFDPVLRRMGAACAADATCAANLGALPFRRMAEILDGAGSLPCAVELGMGRAELSVLVADMMMSSGLSGLVPSLLGRFERCEDGDVHAIEHLGEMLFPSERAGATRLAADDDTAESTALYNNIVFGDLWPTPAPTVADIRRRLDATVLSTGSALVLAQRQAVWPSYPADVYRTKWADSEIPVLTLNGDFDVQTPIEGARAFETKLRGPNKYFVFLPSANHGVIAQSATVDDRICGVEVMTSFLVDPTSRPDASCAERIVPFQATPPPEYARYFYDQPTVWTNGPIATATAIAPASPVDLSWRPRFGRHPLRP